MSKHRQYPCLGGGPERINPGDRCANCGDDAKRIVWVEWDYMRGSDEGFRACQACYDRAQSNLNGFLRGCGKRQELLAGTKENAA